MTATNAKATLLALLDRVEAGEEIEITRHGRTVARLVSATGSLGLRGASLRRGVVLDRGDLGRVMSWPMVSKDAAFRRLASQPVELIW